MNLGNLVTIIIIMAIAGSLIGIFHASYLNANKELSEKITYLSES